MTKREDYTLNIKNATQGVALLILAYTVRPAHILMISSHP